MYILYSYCFPQTIETGEQNKSLKKIIKDTLIVNEKENWKELYLESLVTIKRLEVKLMMKDSSIDELLKHTQSDLEHLSDSSLNSLIILINK
jgi:hypothetical protein